MVTCQSICFPAQIGMSVLIDPLVLSRCASQRQDWDNFCICNQNSRSKLDLITHHSNCKLITYRSQHCLPFLSLKKDAIVCQQFIPWRWTHNSRGESSWQMTPGFMHWALHSGQNKEGYTDPCLRSPRLIPINAGHFWFIPSIFRSECISEGTCLKPPFFKKNVILRSSSDCPPE